jgi:hypothetical protein
MLSRESIIPYRHSCYIFFFYTRDSHPRPRAHTSRTRYIFNAGHRFDIKAALASAARRPDTRAHAHAPAHAHAQATSTGDERTQNRPKVVRQFSILFPVTFIFIPYSVTPRLLGRHSSSRVRFRARLRSSILPHRPSDRPSAPVHPCLSYFLEPSPPVAAAHFHSPVALAAHLSVAPSPRFPLFLSRSRTYSKSSAIRVNNATITSRLRAPELAMSRLRQIKLKKNHSLPLSTRLLISLSFLITFITFITFQALCCPIILTSRSISRSYHLSYLPTFSLTQPQTPPYLHPRAFYYFLLTQSLCLPRAPDISIFLTSKASNDEWL